MPKYIVRVWGTAQIEAENVMQANKVAEKIRLIGNVSGGNRSNHERFTHYRVTITDFGKSLPKRD